jgi:RNA polymerase sigma-70 factor (ECF subfamily)
MAIQDTSLGGAPGSFPSTLGDLLSRARDPSTGVRSAGLEELCRRYWKPVYFHFRVVWRKSNEDAKDLAQAFFAWLLEGEALRRYDLKKGGFRAYLKTLLKRFAQHEEEARQRLKRGGGVRLLDLDDEADWVKTAINDPRAADPERAFDLAWRKTLLAEAVDRVRRRLSSKERSLKFKIFEEHDLCPPASRPSGKGLAERFGLKEGDVRRYLFEVRQEIRSEVRLALEGLVSSAEELEGEWNAFLER